MRCGKNCRATARSNTIIICTEAQEVTPIFVDTLYFVAIFQVNDQWHKAAVDMRKHVTDRDFVTTDTILCEILNYFSGYSVDVRQEASILVRDVLSEQKFVVVEKTHSVLIKGL